MTTASLPLFISEKRKLNQVTSHLRRERAIYRRNSINRTFSQPSLPASDADRSTSSIIVSNHGKVSKHGSIRMQTFFSDKQARRKEMFGWKQRREILCKHRRNLRKDDKESRKILVKAFLEPILTSKEWKRKFNLLNLEGKSSTMEKEKSGSLLSFSIANKQGKTRVDGSPSRQTRCSSLDSTQAFRSEKWDIR